MRISGIFTKNKTTNLIGGFNSALFIMILYKKILCGQYVFSPLGNKKTPAFTGVFCIF